MKMVIAYIRHEAFEAIRADLLEAGFPSITITEVKGSGRQKAITEHYRGSALAVHLRPKIKIECRGGDEGRGRDQGDDPAPRPHGLGRGRQAVRPAGRGCGADPDGEEGETVLQAHDSEEIPAGTWRRRAAWAPGRAMCSPEVNLGARRPVADGASEAT